MSQAMSSDVLNRKPKKRVEWVLKRLKDELSAPGTSRDVIYEVLTRKDGRSFTADLAGSDAQRVYAAVLQTIDSFTTRQQRKLESKSFLLRQLHDQEQARTARLLSPPVMREVPIPFKTTADIGSESGSASSKATPAGASRAASTSKGVSSLAQAAQSIKSDLELLRGAVTSAKEASARREEASVQHRPHASRKRRGHLRINSDSSCSAISSDQEDPGDEIFALVSPPRGQPKKESQAPTPRTPAASKEHSPKVTPIPSSSSSSGPASQRLSKDGKTVGQAHDDAAVKTSGENRPEDINAKGNQASEALPDIEDLSKLPDSVLISLDTTTRSPVLPAATEDSKDAGPKMAEQLSELATELNNVVDKANQIRQEHQTGSIEATVATSRLAQVESEAKATEDRVDRIRSGDLDEGLKTKKRELVNRLAGFFEEVEEFFQKLKQPNKEAEILENRPDPEAEGAISADQQTSTSDQPLISTATSSTDHVEHCEPQVSASDSLHDKVSQPDDPQCGLTIDETQIDRNEEASSPDWELESDPGEARAVPVSEEPLVAEGDVLEDGMGVREGLPLPDNSAEAKCQAAENGPLRDASMPSDPKEAAMNTAENQLAKAQEVSEPSEEHGESSQCSLLPEDRKEKESKDSKLPEDQGIGIHASPMPMEPKEAESDTAENQSEKTHEISKPMDRNQEHGEPSQCPLVTEDRRSKEKKEKKLLGDQNKKINAPVIPSEPKEAESDTVEHQLAKAQQFSKAMDRTQEHGESSQCSSVPEDRKRKGKKEKKSPEDYHAKISASRKHAHTKTEAAVTQPSNAADGRKRRKSEKRRAHLPPPPTGLTQERGDSSRNEFSQSGVSPFDIGTTFPPPASTTVTAAAACRSSTTTTAVAWRTPPSSDTNSCVFSAPAPALRNMPSALEGSCGVRTRLSRSRSRDGKEAHKTEAKILSKDCHSPPKVSATVPSRLPAEDQKKEMLRRQLEQKTREVQALRSKLLMKQSHMQPTAAKDPLRSRVIPAPAVSAAAALAPKTTNIGSLPQPSSPSTAVPPPPVRPAPALRNRTAPEAVSRASVAILAKPASDATDKVATSTVVESSPIVEVDVQRKRRPAPVQPPPGVWDLRQKATRHQSTKVGVVVLDNAPVERSGLRQQELLSGFASSGKVGTEAGVAESGHVISSTRAPPLLTAVINEKKRQLQELMDKRKSIVATTQAESAEAFSEAAPIIDLVSGSP